MKKKIVVALMLIILITGLFVPKVDAGYAENVGFVLFEKTIQVKGKNGKEVTHSSDDDVLAPLKSAGCEGDNISENMKMVTKITITPAEENRSDYVNFSTPGTYRVNFAGLKNAYNVSKEDLINKYGIDESAIKDEETEIESVLFLKCKRKTKKVGIGKGESYEYKVTIDRIYTGDDFRRGYDFLLDGGASLDSNFQQETLVDQIKDLVDGAVDFVTEFSQDAGRAIARVILNFFKAIFDSVQRIINNVQTLTDGSGLSFKDTKLRYTFEELREEKVSDDDLGPNNKYTRVKKVDEDDDTTYEKKWQTLITVDPEEHEFTKDTTAIPVIPIDIYNMAVGNVDLFSVDFLSTSGNNNSIWKFFRSVFSALTHLTIYVTAALLLTTLIYHGIHLVWFSINTTPTDRKEHQDGLQRFATALIMLIGVVVIMALATNASKIFLQPINDATGGTTDELPIRVHVTDTYEFSTNITGFARYMAQSTDFDTMANYTIMYIVLVIINVATAIMMFCRMFIMLLLGILGPIVVAAYALHKENSFPMNFSKWTTNYVKLALIQVFLALVCNIILESGMI